MMERASGRKMHTPQGAIPVVITQLDQIHLLVK
jgi:hypothetical protein